MHPNTNRALMYVQANQLVDLLVTIEPQYRMMISLGYELYLFTQVKESDRILSVGFDRPLLLIGSFNKLLPGANFRGWSKPPIGSIEFRH
jgi:hypothetical protein